MDFGPARSPDPVHLSQTLPDDHWVTPIADDAAINLYGDPADVAERRSTIRLAFVSALQRLPARQRAALVLCDVLRWPATKAADLLEIRDGRIAAVHSFLDTGESFPRFGFPPHLG